MQSLKKRKGKEISGIMVRKNSQDDNYELEKNIQAGMKKVRMSHLGKIPLKISVETE